MPTNIMLGTVPFTGDGVNTGYVYDRLDGWYDLQADVATQKRPNAPGSFGPGQSQPEERPISIEGQYFGRNRADAILARENLTALYAEGREIVMRVTDDLRSTTRRVYIAGVRLPWTIHQEFKFDIDMVAVDARRYGDPVSLTTRLATPSPGLPFPITFPIDFGAIPVDARLTVINTGNTEAVSTFTVANGNMQNGFVIVNVDTGERLTYLGPIFPGNAVTLDGNLRTAFINGNAPGGRYLAAPEWWTVPAGGRRTVQFLARGTVTGTPTMTVTTTPTFY